MRKSNERLIGVNESFYQRYAKAYLLSGEAIITGLLLLLVIMQSAFADEVKLTDKESVFLKTHSEIILGSDVDWLPYIVKTADGTITGFDHDILELINTKTGANFQLIAGKWKSIVRRVKNAEIDGLSTSAVSEQREKYLNFSDSYFSYSKTLVVADKNPANIESINDITGKHIGYQADNIFNQRVLSQYENVTAVPFESLKDIVDALVKGEIDATVGSNSLYYFTDENLAYLKTVDVFPHSEIKLVFSVRKELPEAVSILNKGLKAISAEQRLDLVNKWFIGFNQGRKDDLTEQQTIELSSEEQRYLAGKTDLTVASLDSFIPFNFIEDGVPAGYSVEYMALIGEQIGKKIKFVTKPRGELLAMLASGELDIIPHMVLTSERKAFVDYTNFTHISFLSGLLLHNNETVNSIDDLAGKTLAVSDKHFAYQYLKNKYPEITLLVTKSTTESIDAVARNRVFAAVDNIPRLNYFIHKNWLSNLKIITLDGSDLSTQADFPMAVSKGNFLLKSILEKANTAIPPEQSLKLKQKWLFGENSEKDRLKLNDIEIKFVKEHPVIRFRIRPDRAPFEFVEQGIPAGLAVDYLKAIAEHAGFAAEFVVSDMPVEEAFQAIQGKRTLFDTLAFSVKNAEQQKKFVFGDDFLAYPMVIIGNNDTIPIVNMSNLNGKTVVVEKSFLVNKWLHRDYPNINLINVPSTIEALQLVNDNKADAYVGNLAIANYMMTHGGLKNLKILAPSEYENIKYSFIAPQEWPELATILSKGYRALSPGFHSIVQQRWFTLQIIEKVNYELIWKILASISVIACWALWWHQRIIKAKRETEVVLAKLQDAQCLLEEQNIKLEILSVTDKLTGLSNRQKLDQCLLTEHERCERYGNIFGVIMVDIDHFKAVNDTHGHQVGDAVLKDFADIIKSRTRKVDTAGRWGGEEFMVICSNTDLQVAGKIAEDLRSNIEHYHFSVPGHITASFGVAICKKGEQINQLIEQADKALYISKQQGRNRVTCL